MDPKQHDICQEVDSEASRLPQRKLITRMRRYTAVKRQDQRLARRVQDIFIGRGLVQHRYSIGGGRDLHVPQVISVAAGPPVGLEIRTLPGQTPDDFAAHSSAIAYNLGVAEVRVVPLGPSLLRLDLLPEPG